MDLKVGERLTYLQETDEKSADMKADVERKEYMYKRSKALAFKLSEGTVADRNATAELAPEVLTAAEEWFKAIRDNEAVRAKRQTAALVVEVWRSVNANRRTGNI